MSPTLSVVESIWNLSPDWLDYNLKSLSSQTQPPLEILVTNASSDDEMFAGVERVCAKYPLVRMITARRPTLNLAHMTNVGIKASRGDFVMITAIDRLFSPNFLEHVYRLVAPNRFVHSTARCLPKGFDLGDVDTLMDRWEEILSHAAIAPKYQVGTIMCVARSWLWKVHGMDEERCPFWYSDSDLIHRMAMDDEIQGTLHVDSGKALVLHIGHPSRLGSASGGIFPPASCGLVRNKDGWGEA